jgi:hypothetical protein
MTGRGRRHHCLATPESAQRRCRLDATSDLDASVGQRGQRGAAAVAQPLEEQLHLRGEPLVRPRNLGREGLLLLFVVRRERHLRLHRQSGGRRWARRPWLRAPQFGDPRGSTGWREELPSSAAGLAHLGGVLRGEAIVCGGEEIGFVGAAICLYSRGRLTNTASMWMHFPN